MTAREQVHQVRITSATALRVAVVALGTATALVALDRAQHVLQWLITAAVIAIVLNGPVHALAGRVHRGVAVAAITVVALVVLVVLAYGVADAALDQYRILRSAAPAAAEHLQDSERFGDLARRVRLVERTQHAVDAVPTALLGTPRSAAQTAAQRLAELLLVATLAVFLLAGYDRLVHGFGRLVMTARQRWEVAGALGEGIFRGASAARHALGRACLLGVVTAVIAGLMGLPAAVVLGLWAAWWRLLPVLGIAIGYAPVVLLLLTERSAWAAALAVALITVAELAAFQVEHRAARRPAWALPRAFLSAAALSAGYEYAGVVGAVVTLVLAHLAAGALEALAARPETTGAP